MTLKNMTLKWLEKLKPRLLAETILKSLLTKDQDRVHLCIAWLAPLYVQTKEEMNDTSANETSINGMTLCKLKRNFKTPMVEIAEIDLDLDHLSRIIIAGKVIFLILLKRLHCHEIYIDLLRKEENDRLIVPALQTLRLKVLKDSQPPIPSLNPRLR
jgi:hypothetical protein